MSKKVSVIVPVYNVEKYLPKCLDSLVNQTLEDIEILVVNDGSPDNSQAIIDDYAKRYPDKIRAFVKENGGQSDARNFGVQYAVGEYLGFVDSDDYAREDMFQLLYDKAVEEDADTVVSEYYLVNECSIKEKRHIEHIELFNHCIEEKPEILLECRPYIWNKIFRRKWYTENGFSFPIGQWYEDSAVIYNICYQANKVAAVNECLYFYRTDRKDSSVHTINNRIFEVFKSGTSILSFFHSHTDNQVVLDVAEGLCQFHIQVRMKNAMRFGSLRLRCSFYREMIFFFNRHMPNWTKNPYYNRIEKNSVYLKICHIPALMYGYLLMPERIRGMIKRIIKGRY